MTTEPPDEPKRAGKSKQAEPAETIPRDVGEFVDTVAHEVLSIARLARGLCEADASQESAALIKRRSRALDEGVHGASKSLLDQPLGKILDKKNVHVAEDEAASSVGNLATVIASRLNILLEFAQAVQKRNILGTPEGLQFLDEHRTAHYPRIVPLVEPTADHIQLVEEIAKLKREIAIIQEENDEFAHDLGQRDAEAEFNSSFSSGQSRRHVLGIHLWVAIPLVLLVGLVMTAGISWSSAVHYYDVAGYAEHERQVAEEFETKFRAELLTQLKDMAEMVREQRYQEALILIESMPPEPVGDEAREKRIALVEALLTDIYGDKVDVAHLHEHLVEFEQLRSAPQPTDGEH